VQYTVRDENDIVGANLPVKDMEDVHATAGVLPRETYDSLDKIRDRTCGNGLDAHH
jgi:hypothetical protein